VHRRIAQWILGTLIGTMLLLWSFGWRRDARALKRLDELAATGKPILIVVWHGKYFPLLPMVRNRDVAVITNASFRGMVVGRVCRMFGYTPIHMPVREKVNKMDYIKQALKDGTRILAIVPDGPLGPYHVVKNGAARLASEVGFRILPLSVASSPKMILHKRWDKYEIPPPLARVAIELGEPLDVPDNLTPEMLPPLLQQVADIMHAADAKAEKTLENM